MSRNVACAFLAYMMSTGPSSSQIARMRHQTSLFHLVRGWVTSHLSVQYHLSVYSTGLWGAVVWATGRSSSRSTAQSVGLGGLTLRLRHYNYIIHGVRATCRVTRTHVRTQESGLSADATRPCARALAVGIPRMQLLIRLPASCAGQATWRGGGWTWRGCPASSSPP